MKSRMLAYLVNSLVLFALLVSPLASPAIAHPQANFTVTANNDLVDATPGDGVCETAPGNGMCTLRAAIMEANTHVGADTIILPAATYHLTLPGPNEDLSATGDLDVTESLTITGVGSYDTIIDAEGLNDRVIEIHVTSDPVTLSGLNIRNGDCVNSGGGIANRADTTLQDVQLLFNDTTNLGGAIWSTDWLTLKEVTIQENSATAGGGGIYVAYSHLTTEDTTFLGNSTDMDGGGLYVSSSAKVQLVRTDLRGNTAETDGGNIYNSGELGMEDSTIRQGDAVNAGGGLYIAEGAKATLTNVSITSNHAASAGGVLIGGGADFTGSYLLFDLNSADGLGGAINNQDGILKLVYSTLSNNSANAGGAINTFFGLTSIAASTLISNTAETSGGGIYLTGQMTIKRSTLNANRANLGGGIFNVLGDLWIENSTLSGNRSTENGGGIYNANNTYIYNSTITANLAGATTLPPGGVGGGVYNPVQNLFMMNTILSGNRHRQLINFVDDDCYGVIQSGDYNLIGTLTNCIKSLATHDLIGEDPLLGELADNGGKTFTHALLEGSPAIDGGNPAGCKGIDDILLYFDQRGVNRPQDGDKDGANYCDIGAYELLITTSLYLPLVVKNP